MKTSRFGGGSPFPGGLDINIRLTDKNTVKWSPFLLSFLLAFSPAVGENGSGKEAPIELAPPMDGDVSIPVLTVTPYDAAPSARKEYIKGFTEAFQQILDAIDSGAFFHRTEEVNPKGSEARQKGIHRGIGEALNMTIFRRIAEARKVKIPVPAKTPYDADPACREAYLSAYATAYRLVLAEVLSVCSLKAQSPTLQAEVDGETAGSKAAHKAHPKKMELMIAVH